MVKMIWQTKQDAKVTEKEQRKQRIVDGVKSAKTIAELKQIIKDLAEEIGIVAQ